jgi:hypothetical protein
MFSDAGGCSDLDRALATAVRSDNVTNELPSPEILRKFLRYEPETGKLFWLPRDITFFKHEKYWKLFNTRYANKEAFASNKLSGYKSGEICKKTYLAHRIIWVMQTGQQPKNFIDHIDRNKANNRWENLREANKTQNNANRVSKPNSSSKYLGVCWNKPLKKWRAEIVNSNNKNHLGYFYCEQMAARAYDEAAKRLHGEFANLNFPEARL